MIKRESPDFKSPEVGISALLLGGVPRITQRYQNWNENMALQCNYCNRSHLDKVNQSDYRKRTIHFRKGGRGPISSS